MLVHALQASLSLVVHAFGGMQVVAQPVNGLAARILVWCLVLIALVIVLGLALLLYRRRWLTGEGPEGAGTGWTFDDIRKLREEGELSEAEYQALRSALIGNFKGSAADAQSFATAPETDISDEKRVDFDVKKSPPA